MVFKLWDGHGHFAFDGGLLKRVGGITAVMEGELSQSMREVLPITWLLQEAHDHGIPVLTNPPKRNEGV